MVTAVLRSLFAQEKASEIEARWDDLGVYSQQADQLPSRCEVAMARVSPLTH